MINHLHCAADENKKKRSRKNAGVQAVAVKLIKGALDLQLFVRVSCAQTMPKSFSTSQ